MTSKFTLSMDLSEAEILIIIKALNRLSMQSRLSVETDLATDMELRLKTVWGAHTNPDRNKERTIFAFDGNIYSILPIKHPNPFEKAINDLFLSEKENPINPINNNKESENHDV